MKREINFILKNHTWDIIDRPPRTKSITAKWIYKIKGGPFGILNKLKAPLVARGFQQEKIDYHDIFALIVRWSTIQTIFAFASKFN